MTRDDIIRMAREAGFAMYFAQERANEFVRLAALFAGSRPPRQPLADEEIEQCCYNADNSAADHPLTWKWTTEFARQIERAHGIGDET